MISTSIFYNTSIFFQHKIFSVLIFGFTFLGKSKLIAQISSDNQFSKPLKEVLTDVQKKYGVTIKYADSLVEHKKVTYADWKYRSDVDITLDNILKPLELKVKKEKDKQYKLSTYEYYRWSVEDGWAELDRIASQYKTLQEWEKRKTILKTELLQAMQLDYLPAKPNSNPIITPQRKFIGYTIENIALEILPGVYVNGSLYKPEKFKAKIPVILHPQGHWDKHRYRPDCQITCASLAKMGAMVFNYDMFAWGESQLQFKFEDHRTSRAMSIQVLGSIRILDYLLSLKIADTNRVAIVGGSGGGTYAGFLTAIDSRIKVSAPIISMSSYFYGGCPCESGMNIHACGGRTDNVEIAAMAAPRPMLVISDGGDWTDKMPEHDFFYLQKIYRYYNKTENVTNVHLPNDKHDFGFNKRKPLYEFIAKQFNLSTNLISAPDGSIQDSTITFEAEKAFYVFGDKGEKLPTNAIKGIGNLEKIFQEEISKAKLNKHLKIMEILIL